jgi:mycofactocin system creatininase family protein
VIRLGCPGEKQGINCCACANNWRTPGEFGLPSAGGFPQRARDVNVETAAEHVTRVDCPGRFGRTAWTSPAPGHRYPHRHCRGALAPAIGYGASGEHEGFAGTLSIGTSALRLLLVEFGRSASQWAKRLVFVNGHGGNVEALAAAVALLRYERRDAGWCSCTAENADAHAGHTETSVLLHISPTDVWADECLPGNREPLAQLMPQMRQGGVAAVSELGVLGDPTSATAAEGERILTEMVDGCLRLITRWTPDRDGMLT